MGRYEGAEGARILAHKYHRVGVDGTKAGMGAIAHTATDAREFIFTETASVIHGRRLRGVGRRGAPLRIDIKLYGSVANPGAILHAKGPWHLIERDTRAHAIPRASRRGRRRVAVIPGVGPRSVVHHPGTRGQHPWSKAMPAAKAFASRAWHIDVHHDILRAVKL